MPGMRETPEPNIGVRQDAQDFLLASKVSAMYQFTITNHQPKGLVASPRQKRTKGLPQGPRTMKAKENP